MPLLTELLLDVQQVLYFGKMILPDSILVPELPPNLRARSNYVFAAEA